MRGAMRPGEGLRRMGALLAVLWMASCATAPEPASPSTRSTAPADGTGPVTFDRGPLASLVRDIGLRAGRNIVLMNGLEYRQAGPYTLGKTTPESLVQQLALDAGLLLHREPAYDFVYPPGFEALTAFSPAAGLDRGVARTPASVRLGADTPLYGALALLSHSLRVTLVADNIVAEARCGEMSVQDATLGDAFEAILRSARLTGATCQIQSDGNVVFLSSPTASARETLIVNPPSAPRPDTLDRRVSLYLPAPPADPRRLTESTGATPLRNCLASMSEQLGLRVEADRRCESLPVNPCVIVDLPVEAAMRLVIRQWPLPHYGYTATANAIRIVYLGPPAGDTSPA